MERKPKLFDLVKAILSSSSSADWTKKADFGALLCALHEDETPAQFDILLGVQSHFADQNFPRDDKGQGLVQAAFKALYLNEVVSDEAQQYWRNDESKSEKVKGKVDALVQSTQWFSFLDSLEDQDDDDEEEEEDDDDEDSD